MIRKNFLLILSATLLLANLSCSEVKKENKTTFLAASDRPIDQKEFEIKEKKIAQYFARLHEQTGFNGAVWISKDEHKLYAAAFGFNDIKHQKEPLSISSVFQLASVSKQFTAAAILHLMEEGKLKLSDPVQKFYPNFPYQGINLKMLLLLCIRSRLIYLLCRLLLVLVYIEFLNKFLINFS